MALDQSLAELQAKDANTQHKLDILVSQITFPHIPQSKNLIPSPQPTPVTPKAYGLKLALPSEFDRDQTSFLGWVPPATHLCRNFSDSVR